MNPNVAEPCSNLRRVQFGQRFFVRVNEMSACTQNMRIKKKPRKKVKQKSNKINVFC